MDEKDEAQRRLSIVQHPVNAIGVKIGVYQHCKGPHYTVFAMSVKEDTCELLVHYYSHIHKTRWTRSLDDFQSQVSDTPRFKFIREATTDELLKSLSFTVGMVIAFNP